MEDWKTRLERLMTEKGLNMKSLSLKAGLEQTAVYNVLKRRPDPQLSTVQKLAAALETTVGELVDGVTSEVAVSIVPVVGQVAAGLWFEDGDWDAPRFQPVPIVPTRYRDVEQKAYRVVGNSMNDRGYVDGSYVITVPYWMVRTQMQDGDAVVVERHDGPRRERTVKVVVVGPEEFRLEARSTDPKWDGSAITIPRNFDPRATDNTVEIVGLVIGSYRPEP